jgi:hypothetical protein
MAKLTAAARKKIAPGNFALPGKKAYPIEDRSHAANALSRVSANGSPAEKATVRAKVHAKYPTMGKMHGGGTVGADGPYQLQKGEKVTASPAVHTGHWEIDGSSKKWVTH